MKIKISLFCLFYIFSIRVVAQNSAENKIIPNIFEIFSKPTVSKGKIIILQDDRIKNIVNRYIEIRRKDGKINGYRIRIFSDSGNSARQKAYNESTRFSSLFPDMPSPAIEYETPNFKVYIGGFRTKLEAFRSFKTISKDFKNAFLVPANIELPKL